MPKRGAWLGRGCLLSDVYIYIDNLFMLKNFLFLFFFSLPSLVSMKATFLMALYVPPFLILFSSW